MEGRSRPREATPSPPPALLEVAGACRYIGRHRALDDVHLSVAEGEILALLGPNGAGKTSLIRAVTGRLRLEAGSVRVEGQDPRARPEARRRLGLVPQEIALYRDLTARENLEILGRLAGVPASELRPAVDDALSAIGLSERAGDVVRTLSGGMQRRLNLGAALLHRPSLLLLDEPTVGVDPGAREAIHSMLRDLRQRGLGILLATHDLDQAAELADRIAFLVDGRIREEGKLPELLCREFGGSKELSVVLETEALPGGEALLEREGLAPVRGSRTWTGPLHGGMERVSELARRLEAAGVRLAEVRVREPGIRSIFFRLTGEETGA